MLESFNPGFLQYPALDEPHIVTSLHNLVWRRLVIREQTIALKLIEEQQVMRCEPAFVNHHSGTGDWVWIKGYKRS